MPEALTLGPEAKDAAAVCILMHGRGASPADMAGLAAMLGLPAVRFVMPAAPDRVWYPQSFLAPIAANEPKLTQSLAAYEAHVQALLAGGVPAGRIVLGGFSQGACLTAEFLVRHPRRYGAAAILTGGLIGPPGTTWPAQPALSGMPVYLSGSEVDPHIPVERTEETARVLGGGGAKVDQRIFTDRPHTVVAEEVAAVRAMLVAVAAGRD